MINLVKYILFDLIRNKIILAFTAFLLLVCFVLFSLEENSSKAVLSILNIMLLTVPLVSMIFSTIHYYNSYEFIELLLAQPLSRNKVLVSEFISLAIAFIFALLIGLGLPILFLSPGNEALWLLITGVPLTICCSAMALLVSVNTRDKSKGIGIVLLLWFYFTLIYDGIILIILFSFSDYPLEKLTLLLIALNPIDLARVSIMLKMDISALMGYTGALYKNFFGDLTGIAFTFSILILWTILPLGITLKTFRRKDM